MNLAAGVEGSNTALNIIIFAVFVLITLYIVFRASRTSKTAVDYYAAGHNFTGVQNGIAISGDYLSAASFLGIAGLIALNGYDGFLYSIGFLVAQPAPWTVPLAFGTMIAVSLRGHPPPWAAAAMLRLHLDEHPEPRRVVRDPGHSTRSVRRSSAVRRMTGRLVR